MLGMAWCGFHKNRAGTRYTELAYLNPVGTAGHIVHSSASVRETWSHYFSCWGGTGMYSTESAIGHVMPNLCFCIRWDMPVMLCILLRLGREMLTHYFSCSGATGMYSTKSADGHITLNLCFCIQWDLRVM
jgi:hypothetical protein